MTMGNSEDLSLIERDVDATRERLARNLDRLRSPGTIAGFKEELLTQALETKNQLVRKAQEKLSAGIEDLWAETKARAAANPAAALAIGAGIAWNVVRRPPIASTLIGVGLVSLLRTDARRPAIGAELVSRSMDELVTAKRKVADWAAQEGGLNDATAAVSAVAQDVVQSTVEAAQGIAQKSASVVRDGTRSVVDQVATLPTPSEERDKYLLGAAALALAAAIGIAAQKRA
jgi:hypothetical protein